MKRIMETRVLVYDSQQGYYNLVRDTLQSKFTFYNYTGKMGAVPDFDVLLFFLHEEIELIDYMKLLRQDLKTIFCYDATAGAVHKDYTEEGNVTYVNLHLHKNILIKCINDALKKAQQKTHKKAGV